jgi:LmbE family N-acetylglucosaminyl deacetylase
MRKTVTNILFFITLLSTVVYAQSSAHILHELQKFDKVGSVLYIAAHPDDENTRLITYMANEEKLRTAYLSLTRGDGGQNLVGNEQNEYLGLIRTHELLKARETDGGIQFFTRAVDFGYSKNPEETYTKWDKEKVLADVVWVIRTFKPDVIITRFPPNARAGHGHHTASALLAEEAFDLAANPSVFPEQLAFVEVWQPKRLFFNASTWWDKDLPLLAEKSDSIFSVDIGMYNVLLGKSYGEIAADSRTMHKSQGFGSAQDRGTKQEYLILKKGTLPKQKNIFDEMNVSWSRLENTNKISQLTEQVIKNYDVLNPKKSVPALVNLYKELENLNDNHWKQVKKEKLAQLIFDCLGLHVEAISPDYSAAQNEYIDIKITVLNRSDVPLKIKNISCLNSDTLVNIITKENVKYDFNKTISLNNVPTTQPSWLQKSFSTMFDVPSEQAHVPGNSPSVSASIVVELNDVEFTINKPVQYKWTDRVEGERIRDLVVLPAATANFNNKVYVFSDAKPKKIEVLIQAHQKNWQGVVSLQLAQGWKVFPEEVQLNFLEKNEQQLVSFMVTPPTNAQKIETKVLINKQPALGLVVIDYLHIPIQTVLPESKAELLKLNVSLTAKKIGYIHGAGDEIPKALQEMGAEVELLDDKTLGITDLKKYDAIICGIRAYNTNDFMAKYQSKLMEYVKEGGNVVVQYNTSGDLKVDPIGPFPIKIGRDRVTVEEAVPTFLQPLHPLLNIPNKISLADFDFWVQERGLYFASEWDKNFTPLISWNDPNESPKPGSLLVAHYGKGSFIYTGISFFRQLPAGVPGAYRLMANIVSYKQK